MSEFPDADYPDFEKVVGVLLRPLVAKDSHIGNHLVIEFDQVVEAIGQLDTPFITIRKRGGPIDGDDFTAYPNIEVSCWGKSRQVVVAAEAKVVRLILQSAGEEVDGALIDSAEDITGGEESVLENPDDRCIIRMFRLGFRPQYQD